MATECVIRPWERQLFVGCRRAWDLGAHGRRAFEPRIPAVAVDLERAVKDALAVYYFPGMWDWSRAIVAPLATETFSKSMRTQRQAYEERAGAPLNDEGAARWEADFAAGQRLLPAYYGWAADVDLWSTVQVETLFDVTVPEPGGVDQGLLAADGRGVLYRLRVDLIVVDDDGRCWLVEHRLRPGGWTELDDLFLDERALTGSWGWELGFLATVAGTIHNELRLPAPGEAGPDDVAPPGPDAARVEVEPAGEVLDVRGRRARRDTGAWFRRTTIPRPRPEIEGAGRRVAEQSRLMTSDGLPCYPTPSPSTCTPCEFRAPCLAMMDGADAEPVLGRQYRPRVQRDFEEGRLGSVWGFVPHRPDHSHVRLNPPEPGGGD